MFSIRQESPGRYVLTGRFDAARVEEAESALSQARGPIVLDLRALDYVASAGISVLLRVFKKLHAEGHSMCLERPTPHVLNVLRFSGLDQVFEIQTGGGTDEGSVSQ